MVQTSHAPADLGSDTHSEAIVQRSIGSTNRYDVIVIGSGPEGPLPPFHCRKRRPGTACWRSGLGTARPGTSTRPRGDALALLLKAHEYEPAPTPEPERSASFSAWRSRCSMAPSRSATGPRISRIVRVLGVVWSTLAVRLCRARAMVRHRRGAARRQRDPSGPDRTLAHGAHGARPSPLAAGEALHDAARGLRLSPFDPRSPSRDQHPHDGGVHSCGRCDGHPCAVSRPRGNARCWLLHLWDGG